MRQTLNFARLARCMRNALIPGTTWVSLLPFARTLQRHGTRFDDGRREEYEEDGDPPGSPGKEGVTLLF